MWCVHRCVPCNVRKSEVDTGRFFCHSLHHVLEAASKLQGAPDPITRVLGQQVRTNRPSISMGAGNLYIRSLFVQQALPTEPFPRHSEILSDF